MWASTLWPTLSMCVPRFVNMYVYVVASRNMNRTPYGVNCTENENVKRRSSGEHIQSNSFIWLFYRLLFMVLVMHMCDV